MLAIHSQMTRTAGLPFAAGTFVHAATEQNVRLPHVL